MTVYAPQLNEHAQHDANTRTYLESLIAGVKPAQRPDCGRWNEAVAMVETVFEEANGNAAFLVQMQLSSMIHSQRYPGLEDFLSGSETPEQESVRQPPALIQSSDPDQNFPALPETAQLPGWLSRGASRYRQIYIDYSKKISPEGYEDFHEAGFVSLLSTSNAGRTRIPLASREYCSLMIVFVADTTDYAKTTTVKSVENVLEDAGLRFLLGSGKTTPQRIIFEMTGIVPKDYAELDHDMRERIKQRLAFASRRGWHPGEFGKTVQSMMNVNSPMADLQAFLLEMDDNKPVYENGTMARGNERIERPYLSVLGCATPANLRMNAKKGAEFWTDGFWARIAFICPPEGTGIDKTMELGEVPVPSELAQAIRSWHNRLGVPIVNIEVIKDEKNKETGRFKIERSELQEEVVTFGEGVYEAWERYRLALKQLGRTLPTKDLKGSYGRLPIKAIRIAALLGSFENNGLVEMKHWALAQEIAERWRKSLHELYEQANERAEHRSYVLQDVILECLQKHGPLTVREMQQKNARLKREKPENIRASTCELIRDGEITENREGRKVTFEYLSKQGQS